MRLNAFGQMVKFLLAPHPLGTTCLQVMLAKGNRSKAVTNACKTHGGFYLGSIGGPAAILAKNCIKKMEVCVLSPPFPPALNCLSSLSMLAPSSCTGTRVALGGPECYAISSMVRRTPNV